MMSSGLHKSRRERERREWERLGSLEALLLGVMKERGVLTVYKLYSEMGLSQGSTTRSLRKLVDQGLAVNEADELEEGRKTAYRITEKGDSKLKELWDSGVAHDRGTVHDILITIVLAKLSQDVRQLSDSIQALKDMAGARRVEALSLISKATRGNTRIEDFVSAEFGVWRAIYEAGRIRGEGDALDQIVSMLESGPEFHENEVDQDRTDELERG